MGLEDTLFSTDDRYSIGVESDSGRYYASIPVSNGIVDYKNITSLRRINMVSSYATAQPQSCS